MTLRHATSAVKIPVHVCAGELQQPSVEQLLRSIWGPFASQAVHSMSQPSVESDYAYRPVACDKKQACRRRDEKPAQLPSKPLVMSWCACSTAVFNMKQNDTSATNGVWAKSFKPTVVSYCTFSSIGVLHATCNNHPLQQLKKLCTYLESQWCCHSVHSPALFCCHQLGNLWVQGAA